MVQKLCSELADDTATIPSVAIEDVKVFEAWKKIVQEVDQIIIIIIYLPLSKAQYRLSLRTQVVIENRCEQCMNYTDGICSQMKSLSFSLNIFFIDVFLICPGRKFHNFGPM